MYYTHLVFGVIAAILAKAALNPANIFLFFAVVLIASIFPDIDRVNSKISKRIKLISFILNFIFGHRKIFHSVWPALMISFIIYLFSQIYGLAFGVGYLAHLFADGLTSSGISPFYPLKKPKLSGFIQTGTIDEKILFIVAILVVILLFIYMF